MRAQSFIQESAAKELADKLPTLKRTDYDAIDELMKRVSVKHELSTDKLHRLFVSKYGHTPDTWIKKIKQRNEQAMNEGVETPENEKQVLDFIDWAIETLHIKDPLPKFNFSRDTTAAQKDHRTGLHTSDGSITIYIENRNLVDIFRTIFHELVHHRQDQLNMIGPDDSYPGSPVEAMADMMAGKYIKIYGKQHPEIFQ